MKNKKAQGEIITTVLIILLVLAAIVIVWQVVKNAVTEPVKPIPNTVECMSIDMIVESVTKTSANVVVKVKRNAGGSNVEYPYQLYVAGQALARSDSAELPGNPTTLVPLGTSTTNLPLATTGLVQVTAVVGDQVCGLDEGKPVPA